MLLFYFTNLRSSEVKIDIDNDHGVQVCGLCFFTCLEKMLDFPPDADIGFPLMGADEVWFFNLEQYEHQKFECRIEDLHGDWLRKDMENGVTIMYQMNYFYIANDLVFGPFTEEPDGGDATVIAVVAKLKVIANDLS